MEDRWFGNAFQIFEATDENDLEAMVVLRLILCMVDQSFLLSSAILVTKGGCSTGFDTGANLSC